MFLIVFFLCLFTFYAFGLYEAKKSDWLFPSLTALGLNFIGSIAFFYFISRYSPTIAPKGSLILFFGLFSIMFICLRTVAEKYLLANNQEKILLLTNNKELSEKLKQEVESLGAEILWLTEDFSKDLDLFQKTIEDEKIKIIIADSLFQEEKIYKRIAEFKIELLRPETFFEKKLRKIYLDSPTFELSQIKKDSFTKEIVERSMALMLIIVSSPILLFIAVAIKLSSPGPMIFRQKRIGAKGEIFEALKFRTMIKDAEKNGPIWAQENDPRITSIGKLIRRTHLDETPQLLNILKREMNLVGPRPERPEFTKSLEEKIKFFHLRQLIKPGLTGWAQINYPYGASIQDAKNKLEYDLYYLKHRSFFLDLVILIKTIRFFFFNLARQ